jgi:enoyl-CoA hydratase/carnithine racemase
MLMLGDKVDAEQALAAGLASSVVEDGDLRDATTALARRLADGPALAYGTTKALIQRELDMDLSGAIEMDAMTQALLMLSHDHGEFYKAWSEGRKPDWQGR